LVKSLKLKKKNQYLYKNLICVITGAYVAYNE